MPFGYKLRIELELIPDDPREDFNFYDKVDVHIPNLDIDAAVRDLDSTKKMIGLVGPAFLTLFRKLARTRRKTQQRLMDAAKRARLCPDCAGTGENELTSQVCEMCNGTGYKKGKQP